MPFSDFPSYLLTMLHPGDIRDQVAKLSEIARKFDVFGPPNLGKGPQMSDRILFSPSTMWQSLMTIAKRSWRLGGEERKKERKKI